MHAANIPPIECPIAEILVEPVTAAMYPAAHGRSSRRYVSKS